MVDVTTFVFAFFAILVIIVAAGKRLPRWARSTLIAAEAVIIFFATAITISADR